MAETEQVDLPQKQETWGNFVRLTQWVTGLCALLMVLLAIFLL